MNGDQKFTLEKFKMNERLEAIEAYIRDGKKLREEINETLTTINLHLTNAELMIHGDPKGQTKYIRDGINRRLEAIEEKEEKYDDNDKKKKETFMNIAVGSVVISVGSAIIWVCKVVLESIGKTH